MLAHTDVGLDSLTQALASGTAAVLSLTLGHTRFEIAIRMLGLRSSESRLSDHQSFHLSDRLIESGKQRSTNDSVSNIQLLYTFDTYD